MPPSEYATQRRPLTSNSYSTSSLGDGQSLDVCDNAATFFREYARERPEVVALWAFGIGFVLGWKLKPW